MVKNCPKCGTKMEYDRIKDTLYCPKCKYDERKGAS